MKTIKIQSNENDIHLDCPYCDNWEELGIDDPRKMLNAIPITEWLPDVEGRNEISIHRCTQCNKEFKVEWDYDNPIGLNWITDSLVRQTEKLSSEWDNTGFIILLDGILQAKIWNKLQYLKPETYKEIASVNRDGWILSDDNYSFETTPENLI